MVDFDAGLKTIVPSAMPGRKKGFNTYYELCQECSHERGQHTGGYCAGCMSDCKGKFTGRPTSVWHKFPNGDVARMCTADGARCFFSGTKMVTCSECHRRYRVP